MRTRVPSYNARLVAGRYRLDREMARGGMGTVWIGEDIKLRRAVAVKIMSGELAGSEDARVRFEREATTAAGLHSAHIVQIYDYGMAEERPYIVMELLSGENLSQRLRKRKILPVAECADIVTQICKGLRVAHEASLIHRDLKPSNIFVDERDDAEICKILDFGVVKALSPMGTSDATQTGALLGTPQYMSPEQARARKDIDHRSDLWSVAVIAFRMLSGVNPFGGESVADVILKLCGDELPVVTTLRPELPASADAFFAKAFARVPDERFQSVAELAWAFHEQVARTGLGPAVVGAPAAAAAAAPHVRDAMGSLLEVEDLLDSDIVEVAPVVQAPAQAHDVSVTPALGSRRSGSNHVAGALGPVNPPLATPSSPSGLTPHSGLVSAPGAMMSEPTPHSATVGGTPVQIARFQPSSRVSWLVGGVAVAMLLTMGIAAIYVDSPENPAVDASKTEATSSQPGPAATSPVPLPSATQSPPEPDASASASAEPTSKPKPSATKPAPVPQRAQAPAPAPRSKKKKKRRKKKKSIFE